MRHLVTICFVTATFVQIVQSHSFLDQKSFDGNSMQKELQRPVVEKKVLANGMTILVHQVKTVPKVSLQIWYNVGSKNEKTGEKGLAHLVEHMIFKGTKSLLSESDINVLTHKLSGSCNAFTWYDYTGYLFNMPSHNWEKVLPVIADCMTNCAFKDDHLNSEMKAVIQELKMRNDDYSIVLAEDLLTTIFHDHPYHHPVIGYKQDLWNVSAQQLQDFYYKYYTPNNATLVIVGDVDSRNAFERAEYHFNSIVAHNKNYEPEQFYHNKDIVSKQITLYRDIQQPLVVNAFVMPGFYEKIDRIVDVITLLLGGSKASRLHKRLVNELQLVTSIGVSSWDLFEYGLLLIGFEPKRLEEVKKIESIIQEEIALLINDGPTDDEIERAVKKLQMQYYRLLEDMEQQAYKIGEAFLATGDEQYGLHYLTEPIDILKHKIQNLLQMYARPSIMHRGQVVALPEAEKEMWSLLQQESDQEDEEILSQRERTSPVDEPRYALTVTPAEPKKFKFPQAQKVILSNNIPVFYYHNDATPKVDLIIDLKAKYYYDSLKKPGLYEFVMRMLSEGTSFYDVNQLAQEFEKRGISFSAHPGQIRVSMLKEDFSQGLELLYHVLTESIFDSTCIEKVRAQMLTDIKNFWDEPSSFVGQLVKETLYRDHPYSKNQLGTLESIQSITREDICAFYQEYVNAWGAKIALVGDIAECDIISELEASLGLWQSQQFQDIVFPSLPKTQKQEINYPINRDQITLCFASLSIDRMHEDYNKLLIFDQILGGGALGSMSSRLFDLREQTGLFYTIGGSLISQATHQPGMFIVKTVVSKDRLKEAEEAILHTVKTSAQTISQEEFDRAKSAIVHALVDFFESNYDIAQAFLLLDKYNLPATYFDNRMEELRAIDIKSVQQAVANVVDIDRLCTLRIGRIAEV